MTRPLTTSRFQEEMLRIMDRKHHWAWPAFSDGTATKDQMTRHFQQEFAVYVRDFPVLLARIHGQNPPPAVRRAGRADRRRVWNRYAFRGDVAAL